MAPCQPPTSFPQEEDLPPLPRGRPVADVAPTHHNAWEAECESQEAPSFLRVVALLYGEAFLVTGLLELGEVLLGLCVPLVMTAILRGLAPDAAAAGAGPGAPPFRGGTLLWTCALFLLMLGRAVVCSAKDHRNHRIGLDAGTGACALVHAKLLRLSAGVRYDRGGVLNLVSADAKRLHDGVMALHTLWSGPLQVLAALALLYAYLGLAALPGTALVLAAAGLQGLGVRRLTLAREQTTLWTDRRVAFMSELLNGIKAVKFSSLEDQFAHRSRALGRARAHSGGRVRMRPPPLPGR